LGAAPQILPRLRAGDVPAPNAQPSPKIGCEVLTMSSAAPSDKDGKGPSWWDREVDYSGRPNRADVRRAAHEVWGHACARLQVILGDASDAGELMEKSVSVISRYLDRIGSPPFAESRNGLLMKAFSSALRRYAMKLGRIELVEDLGAFSEQHPGPGGATKEDCRLDAEKAARYLSQRGRTMLGASERWI